MNNLKIQLYVNDHALNNVRDYVSKKFHIFLDDVSLCEKCTQDTEFFETDLNSFHENLLELPIEELKTLVKENKTDICSKCYKNFVGWFKKYETKFDGEKLKDF